MYYLSLLRGINVSGKNTIKMEALRQLYLDLGLEDVSSYIQSGNIIFTLGQHSIKGLEQLLQQAIKKQFGHDVPVLIRSRQQINKVLQSMPFADVDLQRQGNLVLVSFLSATPGKNKLSLLQEYLGAGEKISHSGKEVYLYCPQGHGKSKLSNTLIEKKLGVCASTRNIKTITKLQQMMSADS